MQMHMKHQTSSATGLHGVTSGGLHAAAAYGIHQTPGGPISHGWQGPAPYLPSQPHHHIHSGQPHGPHPLPKSFHALPMGALHQGASAAPPMNVTFYRAS
eukprot:GDKI01015362.1.p2 GENE.GDKI01015362.1~~GDKI01015362.1.p2  ORF type:complete len:116 (-),score=4.81 GDKI01015362.1:269-568(-)